MGGFLFHRFKQSSSYIGMLLNSTELPFSIKTYLLPKLESNKKQIKQMSLIIQIRIIPWTKKKLATRLFLILVSYILRQEDDKIIETTFRCRLILPLGLTIFLSHSPLICMPLINFLLILVKSLFLI